MRPVPARSPGTTRPRRALELAGRKVEVAAVSTAEYGSATPRPLYSVLAHGALERAGLYVMRHWDVALAEWIALRGDLK